MKKYSKLTAKQLKQIIKVLNILYQLEDETGYTARPLGKAINWLQKEY